MLEPYTIENTENIFSKKCAMKWLHLLVQTLTINGHEEYFRVLYAINELLG